MDSEQQAVLAAATAAATLCCCAATHTAPAAVEKQAGIIPDPTAAACDVPAHRRLVVVGTGAARDKDNPHKWNGLSSIMVFSLRSDGALEPEFELPDVGVNPMFMCSADSGRILYAVDMGAKQNAATLQTYAVDHSSRTLSKLGEISTADGPCHISTTSKDGRDVFGAPRTTQMVLVANYGAGKVGVHLARPDWTLGPAVCTIAHGAGATPGVGRQDQAHPHGISVTPDGQFVFVADLGRNSVFMYALRQDGQLAELAEHVLHEGAGPRHLAFAQGVAESPWVPQGVETGCVYVINELDNTISVLEYDTQGFSSELELMQTISTLPEGWETSSPPKPFDFYDRPSHASEIGFSDDGKFLYAANRGHDSIAVFELNADSTLSLVEVVPSGGRVPWTMSFADVPGADHQLMLVQNEFSGKSTEPVPPGNVCVFRRDLSTGRLKATGHTAVIEKPMFVGILPDPEKK